LKSMSRQLNQGSRPSEDALAKEAECGITAYVEPPVDGVRLNGVLKHRYADFQVYEVDCSGKRASIQSLTTRSNKVDDGKTTAENKKRPRDRDKLALRAEKRRAVALRTALETTTPWKRYLCASLPMDVENVELDGTTVAQATPQPSLASPLASWQKYLVQGFDPVNADTVELTVEQRAGLAALENFVGKKATAEFKQLFVDPSKVVCFPSSKDKQTRREVHMTLKLFRRPFDVVADTVEENGAKIVRVRCAALSKSGTRDQGQSAKTETFDPRGHGEQWPSDRGQYIRFVLYKENMDSASMVDALGSVLRVRGHKRFATAGTKDKRAVTAQVMTGYRITMDQLAVVNERRGGPCRDLWVGNAEYVEEKTFLGNLYGNEFRIVLRDVAVAAEGKPPPTLKQVQETIQSGIVRIKKAGFINYFGLQRFGTGAVRTHTIGAAILKRSWKEALELIMRKQPREKPVVAKARRLYQEGKIRDAGRVFPPYMVTEKTICKALSEHGANSYSTALASLPQQLRTLYTHAYQSFVWNQAVSARMSTQDGHRVLRGDLVLTKEDTAVYVTEEDLVSSKYTIADVVFPVVGDSILYPQNAFGEMMVSLMKEGGVSLEDIAQATATEYGLRGAYRKIIERATHVACDVKSYIGRDNITLCTSELETLLKTTPYVPPPRDDKVDDKERIAVILKFRLPKSSYATMCLREVITAKT
jgi:tRNA pseudouridine13 synthase